MRIIAGRMRGLKLTPVGKGDTNAHLRPTSDRVRESIFNLLLGGPYGDPVTNARVLDLFAGLDRLVAVFRPDPSHRVSARLTGPGQGGKDR